MENLGQKNRVLGSKRRLTDDSTIWQLPYVDDFLIALDEECGSTLRAGGRERCTIGELRNAARSHGAVFKSCGVVIKVVEEVSHSRAPSTLNHQYSWICHLLEENNVKSQSLQENGPRFVVRWDS